MINEINLQQENQISFYREKWKKIALSTEPIAPKKAAETISSVYQNAGIEVPEIVFCSSPYAAFRYTSQAEISSERTVYLPNICSTREVQENNSSSATTIQESCQQILNEIRMKQRRSEFLGDSVLERLSQEISEKLNNQISDQISEALTVELQRLSKPEETHLVFNLPEIPFGLWKALGEQLNVIGWQYNHEGPPIRDSMRSCWWGSWLDFCISALKCSYDENKWQVLQALNQDFGWIIPYEKVCLICDRPTYISFDGNCPVYEVGEATVQYADGFKIIGNFEGSPTSKGFQFVFPDSAYWSVIDSNEMSTVNFPTFIAELAANQVDQIPIYLETWKAVIFKTGSIDRGKAYDSIVRAYAAIGESPPKIVFCSNPKITESERSKDWSREKFGERLDRRFDRLIWTDLENELWGQLSYELVKRLRSEFNSKLNDLYFKSGENHLPRHLGRESDIIDLGWYVNPRWWAFAGALMDFCISVLGCHYPVDRWQAFQDITQHCGWIFPSTKICYISDRPIQAFVPTHE